MSILNRIVFLDTTQDYMENVNDFPDITKKIALVQYVKSNVRLVFQLRLRLGLPVEFINTSNALNLESLNFEKRLYWLHFYCSIVTRLM